MIRVLLDTNVLISALLFGGLPGRLLTFALARAFRLISSPILIEELMERLQTKFHLHELDLAGTRNMLDEICDVISTVEGARIVAADPDDDRVIECAVAGHADYIVTGDRHLLDLGSFNGIPILTVRQFMDRFAPAS